MNKRLASLQLRQFDEKLEKYRELADSEPPRGGWIKAIRVALGITTEQLAGRLGITRQAVLQLESAERKKTASWTSLRKAADAMDCVVVMAVVPRGSLSQILLRQGRRQAERHLARIAHSMRLDAHVVPPEEESHQVDELAAILAINRTRALWAADPDPAPQPPPPRYHGRSRKVG